MADSQVAVDWAWVSKDPSGSDYGVQATSGRADLGEFVGLPSGGMPDPPDVPDAPDAPPWVTFAPHVDDHDDRLVSVSALDPWRVRDRFGRPVWPQRFFLFRFTDLKAAGASFQTMWRAVEARTLPPNGAAPEGSAVRPGLDAAQEVTQWEPGTWNGEPGRLVLAVGTQSQDELAEVIQKANFEWLAGLAVAVLEGPVVITGAGALTRERRLKLLDAVAALLPYGFRADLAASSLVGNKSNHQIRVVFAGFPRVLESDGVRREQQVVGLMGGSVGPPDTETGREYLTLLRQRRDTSGLKRLINYLWTDEQPRSFARPQEAVDFLRALDREGSAHRNALNRTLTRHEMLNLCRELDPAEMRSWLYADLMTDELRVLAVSKLLDQLDSDAADALIRHWSAMAEAVRLMIESELEFGEIGLVAWCLSEVSPALSADAEDQLLLAPLLVLEQTARELTTQRRSALVRLLRQREAPPRDTLTATCAVLRRGDLGDWQALLVRELLAGEVTAAPDRAGDWVDWLSMSTAPQLPPSDWAAALGYAGRDHDGAPVPESFQQMMLDCEWAVIMLWLARATGRLAPVLEAGVSSLLELAARSTTFAGNPPGPGACNPGAVLAALYTGLWDPGVPAWTVAAVDVVRISLGDYPWSLPHDESPEILNSYGGSLTHQLMRGPLRRWRDRLQWQILDAAVRGGSPSRLALWLLNNWAINDELRLGLVNYIADLPEEAFPYSEELTAEFWDALMLDDRVRGFASSERIMRATRVAIDRPEALTRMVGPTGLSNTELALACHAAQLAGLQVRGIVHAIGQVTCSVPDGPLNAIPPSELYAILREIQSLSFYAAGSPAGRQYAESDLEESVRLIAGGAFGRAYGGEFIRVVRSQSRNEKRARRWLHRKALPKRFWPRGRSKYAPRRPDAAPVPGPRPEHFAPKAGAPEHQALKPVGAASQDERVRPRSWLRRGTHASGSRPEDG